VDYGADVIWVEPPGGDPYRGDLANYYAANNRGKRSIVLDLRSGTDRERAIGLLSGADLLVHSWRPGVAERLGLAYEDLHPRLPGLVHTSISGFGPDVSRLSVPGYESLVHAVVGTMGEQRGYRDGPIYEGLPFASMGAASLAVIGSLAALYRREDDGLGRRVETSLVDGALAYLAMAWSDMDVDVPRTGASGKRTVVGTFVCGDGNYLGIHTGAVGAFGRLMEVLGVADRFPPSQDGLDMALQATPDELVFLEQEMPRMLAEEPRTVWLERLLGADVCAIPVLHPCEVFDERQAIHNRMVVEVSDPVLGLVQQVAPPARFSVTPAGTPVGAPTVGQHTDEISRQAWEPRSSSPSGTPDTRSLLAGVKILDFGAYYAGPFASRLLADLGAEVVKIETLAGDPLRGQERVFPSGHAGKKSIALDMKDADGQAIGQALAAWADVVQHNMRPGAAERLGLSYEQVRALNPEVIYAYSPGWGSEGPDYRRQGFAPMYSGYVGASFEVAGRGNPPIMPTGNEDPGNGLLGAKGILMALLHRRRTGRGQYVEHPQINATMTHLAHVARRRDGTVVGAATLDEHQMGIGPLDRLYRTADGWICLAAHRDDHFADLCRALDLARLADDPRFDQQAGRHEHGQELTGLLEAAFAGLSTAEAQSRLDSCEIPSEVPVPYNCEAFLNDPANRGTGRVAESPHPKLGSVREIAKLIRFSDAAVAPHRRAPTLGEHSDEILASLGYDPSQVAKLRSSGVIR
jgi:crotonobetainyl-CoA:carnitine CoA-transferase CaiB-like acyl-CoA transferase